MAFLRKIKAGLVKIPREDFQADPGQLFYDVDTGQLYIGAEQNGQTIVGGVPVGFQPGVTTTNDIPEGNNNLYYTEQRVLDDITSTVTAAYVAALNTDADTLDGLDSTYFATATGLNNLEATVNSLDTDDIPEGTTNLYWTQVRFDSAFGNKTTDQLTEGTGNLYYTNARVVATIGGVIDDGGIANNDIWSAVRILSEVDSAVGQGGTYGIQTTTGTGDDDQIIRTNGAGLLDSSFFGDLTTDNVLEGSNLYYTDARAIAAIGGVIDDVGTAADDIWSADRILTEFDNQIGTGGIQTTSGAVDANKIIRTDANGYLDATFLDGVTTSDLAEGTNLYYTQSRFDSAFTAKSTDDLSEGTTNLYFTNSRAIAAIDGQKNDLGAGVNDLWSANRILTEFDTQVAQGGSAGIDATTGTADDAQLIRTNGAGVLDPSFLSDTTTDDIAEGLNNLYYTDIRADNQIDLHKFENTYYIDRLPAGSKEYSNINDAIAAINANPSAPGPTNQVLIWVGPGTYYADPIVIPPWVSIMGSDGSTRIVPNDETVDFITLSPNTNVSNLTVNGPTTAGTRTFAVDPTISSGPILFNDVRFADSAGYLRFINNTANNILVSMRFCSAVGDASTTLPWEIEGASTGRTDFVIDGFGHFIANPVTSIDHYFQAKGPSTHVAIANMVANVIAGTVNHMFHLENGVDFVLSAVAVDNATSTIHVENVGAGPRVRVTGLTSNAQTWDLAVQNPNTTGSVTGVMNTDKISVDPASLLTVSIVDPEDPKNGTAIAGSMYQGDRMDRLINISRLIRNSGTLGLLEGGAITPVTGTTDITVGAGSGYIKDSTDDYVVEISWPETTLSLPVNDVRWILVNPQGTVLDSPSPPSSSLNFIILGRVFTGSSSVKFVEKLGVSLAHAGNQAAEYLAQGIGPLYASGSVVAENTTTARALDISAGRYFFSLNEYDPSGATAAEFILEYQDGVGGFTELEGQTQVPVQWDNGSGTLQSLTAGYFAKHSLYVVGEGANETYFVVVAQAEYDNLAVAEQAAIPLPPGFVNHSFALIASIIVEQGNNNINTIIDERPIIGFKAGAVSAATTHSNLLGLTNDDHLQYLRTDGSRTMTGGLNLGTNSISNVTTVNGVTVEAHASRHLPNGADPIATGVAVTIGTTNSEGVQNSLARRDHVHAHGNQPGGTLHALATQSVAGFLSAADKTKLDTIDTDDVTEGTTNLYFTDERVDDRVANLLSGGTDLNVVYNDLGNNLTVNVESSTSSVADTIVKRDANSSFGIGSVIFDTQDPAQHATGMLHWNTVAGGLEVDMAGSTVRLQVGQELLSRAFNDTGATISNGTVVTITGSQLNFMTVEPALAIASLDYDVVLGVATEDIVDQTEGFINSFGKVRGINTDSFAEGDALYLSTSIPGGLTNVKPTEPDKAIFIGVVIRSHPTLGIILVRPSINRSIEDLNDVRITNVQNGNIIQWDTDKFVNTDGFSTFTSVSDFSALESTVANLTTTDIAEGTNLYYTQARFDTAFAAKSTTDLSEGTNLYFTDARAIAAIGGSKNDVGAGINDLWSADQIITYVGDETAGIQASSGVANANELIRTDANGYLDASFIVGLDTDDLSEGTSNLYYTQARFDTAFGNKSTDDLGEGISNLYFTSSRAINAIGGSKNDGGTTVNDLWSADKIITEIANTPAGIQTTTGVSDSNKIIRTDLDGYLDNSFLGGVTTSDLSEGTNLYYTQTRFNSAFAAKSTSNLSEGTNLYFTNTRAVNAIGGQLNDAGTGSNDLWSATKIQNEIDGALGAGGTAGIQSTTGASDANKLIRTDSAGYLDASFLANTTTDAIAEGTSNLYFTAQRAQDAILAAAAPAVNISANTNTEGTATTFVRSDHTHQLSSTAPTTNDIMEWDGSNWVVQRIVNVYSEVETEQSTTSITFVQALSATYNLPISGDYEVTWYAEARNSAKDRDVVIRVQMDNATTLCEASHARQNDQLTPTWYSIGGFRRYNIAAGTHTFDFDYRAGANTAFVRRVRLHIKRILPGSL